MGATVSATPTLPTAWLGRVAADVIQRGSACLVVYEQLPFTTVVNIYIMSTVDLLEGGICQ